MLNGLQTKVKECAIGGKLVSVNCTTSSEINIVDVAEEIKHKLAVELARFMVQNNLIEFTQMVDSHTWATRVNARAYLVPNDQIKIVRMMENR